jgi:hypothetical protein
MQRYKDAIKAKSWSKFGSALVQGTRDMFRVRDFAKEMMARFFRPLCSIKGTSQLTPMHAVSNAEWLGDEQKIDTKNWLRFHAGCR